MLGDDAGTPSVIGALVDNHGGDLGLALDLVDIAADAGCSAVSLRRCATEDAYTDEVLRRANRGWPEAGPTVRNLLESFRLPANALPEVRDRCRGSLDLVAAPYDLASLEEVAALEPEAYQVEPPVLGHVPLLRELAATGRPVLVVCGACTSEEIARALSVLGEDHTMLLHTVAADEVTLAETALGY